jgi:hypothetical protein
MAEIDWSLKRDYLIEHVDASESVSRRDVADLWVREEALPRPRAERRISQVCLVATTPEGELAGVSTAYVAPNRQLRLELWHIRAFVAEKHRAGHLATQLLWRTRDHLAEGFASGKHTAPGAMVEVENEDVKRLFPEVLWQPTMFTFIGNNSRGDHCRVHWFEGALLPPPPSTPGR